MKNTRTFNLSLVKNCGLLLLLVAGTVLSSCKKEEESEIVSEEEAAEAIVKSVEESSGGMTAQVEDMAVVMEQYNETVNCGVVENNSYSNASANGATVSFNANYNWQWVLNCTNLNVPSTFDFELSGSRTYDAPRMSSDDQLTATVTATGLEPNAPSYVFNQTFLRSGSQQSKIKNNGSFTSSISVVTSNLTVNKSSYMIESGSATVTISGTSSTGDSFSFNGS